MIHPFAILQSEYLDLLGRLKITREADARTAAGRIIKLMPRYKVISAKTGVPAVWIAAINERESGSSTACFLGNGQRLTRVTTIVPKGLGPWTTFEDGCVCALSYDHITDIKDWTWAQFCYAAEAWNGFGPRNHGKRTGYLYSGTDLYTGGKYISDGVWNPDFFDPQLGVIPVALALIALDPSLALPGWPANNPWPSASASAAVPPGHDGGDHGTVWLQDSLNKLANAGLIDDGSYGRKTAGAVRAFQEAHGLEVDGLAGVKTCGAIEAALAALPTQAAA